MSGASGGFRGRGSARLWILLGSFLALGAAGAVVFADDFRWLRLGIVAALWAALLGAFLATRNHRDARVSEQEARDAQAVYELELEREVAARREHELTAESEARARIDSETLEEVQALRSEVGALRDTLQQLMGGQVLYERVALTAESTRLQQLGEQGSSPVAGVAHTGVVEAGRRETSGVRSALDPDTPQRSEVGETQVFGAVAATDQAEAQAANVEARQSARPADSEHLAALRSNSAGMQAFRARDESPSQRTGQSAPPRQPQPRQPQPARPAQPGRPQAAQRQGVPVARPGGPDGHQPQRSGGAGPPDNTRTAVDRDQRSGPQPPRATWQGRQPGGETPQGGWAQRPVQEPQQPTRQPRQATDQPQRATWQRQRPARQGQGSDRAEQSRQSPSSGELGTAQPRRPGPAGSDGNDRPVEPSEGLSEEPSAGSSEEPEPQAVQQPTDEQGSGSHAEGRSVNELLAAYGSSAGSRPHRRRRAQ